jgi:hypothetical protein
MKPAVVDCAVLISKYETFLLSVLLLLLLPSATFQTATSSQCKPYSCLQVPRTHKQQQHSATVSNRQQHTAAIRKQRQLIQLPQ